VDFSNPLDLDHGERTDRVVVLTGTASAKAYPDRLRCIRFYDAEQEREVAFLTNNFMLSETTIARL
jgi:hypothetical protein